MSERAKAISSRHSSLLFLVGLTLLGWYGAASCCAPASAAETLRLSSSAQVYEAFRGEYLELFQQKTGIVVDAEIVSSSAAVLRLANELSEVAATAEGLNQRFRDEGLREFPFSRDALVVITHARNPVQSLSEAQLRSVFSGEVANWQQVGGRNLRIRVIVPSRETAAYKMFSGMVMRGRDVDYYAMSARSTSVVEITRKFLGAVSFVNQAALLGRSEAPHAVQIDGRGPVDPGYPYYEIFYLVTRGRPAGAADRFVDFAFSEDARRILTARGMKPIEK